MKQFVQSLRTGSAELLDVPAPQVRSNGILVRTAASLISPGTERAALEFGRKSLLSKARSRPDLVRQVLEKVKRDGFLEAARIALSRLDHPIPMGYSCSGIVIAVGAEASEFRIGDRVACAGAGYASHAEVNYIPRNLAVAIPRRSSGECLSFEEASFGTLGAIALHAVHLAGPDVGDRVVVIGLGLVGLLLAQIARTGGCQVIGVDPDAARCALARELGVECAVSPEEAIEATRHFTNGVGADRIFLAAAAQNSQPVVLAGEIARDRAKIVAVGDTKLELPRRLYYAKELSFVVSRSYGPGRYDPAFEERGADYPAGYVRWTERENLRAFLELAAQNRILTEPLISHRFPIDEAEKAYEILETPGTISVILQYGHSEESPSGETSLAAERVRLKPVTRSLPGRVGVSLIGAGNFARGVLLPILKRLDNIELRGIMTAGGLTARHNGDKFGFSYCVSDPDAIMEDPETHAVIVAARNHLHAGLVKQAVHAGKAVFVEKPLCLSESELEEIIGIYRQKMLVEGERPMIMVGFNRRFSPLVQAVKSSFASGARPSAINYRINGGLLPAGSWIADPSEGGGRIVSEICHFIDLASFLAGERIHSVFAQSRDGGEDDVAITLRFVNGCLATIGYFSQGDKSFSKERIEIFGSGAAAVIDDFRCGFFTRAGKHRRFGWRLSKQQKGHREELMAFFEAVQEGRSCPIPFEEAAGSTRATFAVRESLSRGNPVILQG